MDNRIVVLLLLLLTAGLAYATEDWNLGVTQTFTGVNATNINITDGSSSSIPAGVITSGTLRNASAPLSSLNRSDQNVYSANESNISVAKQPNGSYAVNLAVGLSSGTGVITTATFNRSYVINTVYQNTNSTSMFMTVTAYATGSGYYGCNYKTGTTNPPTEMVGSYAETTAEMQSFWVLPQHYFAAFQSTGTCTILSWSVWQ